MPYIVVENFGGGMDVRRSSAAAPGGTMRLIENAFVNKGGEIEKRRKWFPLQDSQDVLYGANVYSAGKMCGPIPSFDRDGVWFAVDVGEGEPTAAGDWAADGGGATATLGDYRFGVLEAGSADRDIYTSVAMFADEMIVTMALPGVGSIDTDEVFNFLFPVAAGNMLPTSGTAITARSGDIEPSANAGAFTFSNISAFDSAVYVAPNIYALRKSEVSAPESDTGTGFGSADIRARGMANGRPLAITKYFNQAAIFCEGGIQFWNIDADFANFAFVRSIDGEAIVGPRAFTPYGDGDILYVTANGVRSLRARDSSNFAATTDTGSPIDSLVAGAIIALDTVRKRTCFALIHRDSGQAWVFIGDQIFVYARYPSSRVSAWTVFTAPETESANIAAGQVADGCPIRETVCIRLWANEVFLYGDTDLDGNHYDAAEATVTTHYFGVEQPYTEKVWRSIDLACEGTWTIEYSIDPRNEEWVSLGSVTGDTHLSGGPQIDVSSPLMAFRFKTTSASAAKLSQFAIHYDTTEIKA